MTRDAKRLRCAIYTRVSTEHGLEQDFNSLDAQREAAEAYIKSQAHEGWAPIKTQYDDGGFSGASMDRPALQRLLIDLQAGTVDVVVVYKVDRLRIRDKIAASKKRGLWVGGMVPLGYESRDKKLVIATLAQVPHQLVEGCRTR